MQDTHSGSLLHFCHHCGIGDLLAFLIQSPANCLATLGELTVGLWCMILGVYDLTDIRIRIWINPKMWVRIPDHFWLTLDALAEVLAL